MPTVHAIAQSGFGPGTNAFYNRARPTYQAFALAHIRQAVRAAGSLNIVEIGAGTGIFTRALLAHLDWTSSVQTLIAVEPSEGMRDVFSDTVHDERVSVLKGTFDSTTISDGWADLVVIAQAFHWCPDYDLACAEFARILKPDGVVALIWNLEDREKGRWVAQLRDCIESHECGSPQFRLNLWRQAFDTESYQKFFQPPEEKIWSYSLPGTVDLVLDRACSKSYIAILSDDQRAKLREDIKQILNRGDDLVWMDKASGILEYPYKTWVVIAQRSSC